MKTHTDDFLPTRISLLSRLRNWDDTNSWEHFFKTYGKLIYSVACKAGLSDAEAQDVVQETIIAVAKEIPRFHYDRSIGSFKSWLLTITRHRIGDCVRKKQYQCHGQRRPREETLHTSLLEAQPNTTLDLQNTWNQEWQRNLMELATDKIRGQAAPANTSSFNCTSSKTCPPGASPNASASNSWTSTSPNTKSPRSSKRKSAGWKRECPEMRAAMLSATAGIPHPARGRECRASCPCAGLSSTVDL